MLADPGPATVIVAETQSQAAPDLPAGVGEMIDAALASGDTAEADAVIRAAKRAYPRLAEVIDRRLAARKATIVLPATSPPVALAVAAPRAAPPPAPPASVKAAGEGEAGAFSNTGNAPGIGVVGGFKLRLEGPNWRVATAVRADYQEAANVVTREQYRLTVEPDYKFDDRGYLFGLGQFEQDRFQGFASRYSLSGGLGYGLLQSEGAKLSIKAGPAWRLTNNVTGERESVLAGLASAEAKIKLTPSLEFSQDASAYVDAQGSTFYTLLALDSRLIGKLKARLSYMIQHETAPELGRLGTDTTSRLTLVYGF